MSEWTNLPSSWICQEGETAARAQTEDLDSFFIFLVFAWCVLFTKRATFIRMDTAAVLLRAPSSLGVRVVLVSDTHGMHRTLDMPDGDILIHGGDFTRFGKREDAVDFNLWLGDLPYAHRFVVLGNHEATAEWREDVAEILSNAVLLCDSGVSVPLPATAASASTAAASGTAPGAAAAAATEGGDAAGAATAAKSLDTEVPGAEEDTVAVVANASAVATAATALRIWGTDFYWPTETPQGSAYFTPPYASIPPETHIIVAHGPAFGHVDGNTGCPCILEHVARVQPLLFVCGHIHEARGACEGRDERIAGTLFVNAANEKPRHFSVKNKSTSAAGAKKGLLVPHVIQL